MIGSASPDVPHPQIPTSNFECPTCLAPFPSQPHQKAYMSPKFRPWCGRDLLVWMKLSSEIAAVDEHQRVGYRDALRKLPSSQYTRENRFCCGACTWLYGHEYPMNYTDWKSPIYRPLYLHPLFFSSAGFFGHHPLERRSPVFIVAALFGLFSLSIYNIKRTWGTSSGTNIPVLSLSLRVLVSPSFPASLING